jgi:large subunit ribosomal protein L25
MSGDKIEVELEERKTLGKGLAKLRHEGKIPAVIHERGKASQHVMGDYAKLTKIYAHAGKHHPVQIHVGDKQHLAMIKEADFHPAKNRLRHLVFQAINRNEKVTAEIPVVLVGEEIPAEIAGHIVLPQLDTLQVEALPNNLPDKIEADARRLAEVGDKLTVADLKVPEGVTILTEPETSVAVVEMPKDQLAEANASAEALAEDAAKTEGEGEETAAEDKGKAEEAPSEESTEAPAAEEKDS